MRHFIFLVLLLSINCKTTHNYRRIDRSPESRSLYQKLANQIQSDSKDFLKRNNNEKGGGRIRSSQKRTFLIAFNALRTRKEGGS